MALISRRKSDVKEVERQVLAVRTNSNEPSVVPIIADSDKDKYSLEGACAYRNYAVNEVPEMGMNNGKTDAINYKDVCFGTDMQTYSEIKKVGEKSDEDAITTEKATAESKNMETLKESEGVLKKLSCVVPYSIRHTLSADALEASTVMDDSKNSNNISLQDSPKSVGSTFNQKLNDEQLKRGGQAVAKKLIVRKMGQQYLKKKAEEKEKQRREEAWELQKQLAEERYDEWCKKKEKQKIKGYKKAGGFKLAIFSKSDSCRSIGKSHAKESAENDEEPLKELKRAKQSKECFMREHLRMQKETQVRFGELRKIKSQTAGKIWINVIDSRPEPLQLKQGKKSLRGIFSQINASPKKWISNKV